MPGKKTVQNQPPSPRSAGLVIWSGTKAEYEAVLRMRQGELNELVASRDAMVAKGAGTNSFLDSNIVNLKIQLELLRKLRE